MGRAGVTGVGIRQGPRTSALRRGDDAESDRFAAELTEDLRAGDPVIAEARRQLHRVRDAARAIGEIRVPSVQGEGCVVSAAEIPTDLSKWRLAFARTTYDLATRQSCRRAQLL